MFGFALEREVEEQNERLLLNDNLGMSCCLQIRSVENCNRESEENLEFVDRMNRVIEMGR
jgi:hypothetical protein